ncbi:MAG: transposase family protein [Cytophagales bacterium]|nr:transposase family protein [Cytophagales bacterium]
MEVLNVVELWKQNPISAAQFARENPVEGYSKKQVESIIRRSQEYGVLSQGPKYKKYIPRRFINSELRRGALTFVDSAYFMHYFGHKFVMVHIDYYSKLVQYEPMGRLTGRVAADVFERILARIPYGKIDKLVSDRGSEYTSHEFSSMLARHNIEHILTSSTWDNKAQASERAILTLRTRLGTLRELGHGVNLATLLPKVEKLVNSTKNSTTRLSPNNTTNETALHVLDKRREKRYKLTKGRTPKPRYKIGDFVRVKHLPTQSAFAKASQHSYGSDVYKIHGIKETRPEISYILTTPSGEEVSTGSFPESRLKPANEPDGQVQEKIVPRSRQRPTIVDHRPITRSMNLHK